MYVYIYIYICVLTLIIIIKKINIIPMLNNNGSAHLAPSTQKTRCSCDRLFTFLLFNCAFNHSIYVL